MRIKGVVLAGAGAAGVWLAACSSRDAGAPAAGTGGGGVPVSVAVAEKRDVPERLKTIGTIEPVATVIVKPRINGQLLETKFVEGQDVKAGDVLLVIDQRPFQAALHEAEARQAQSKTMAADAGRWMERVKQAEQNSATTSRETEAARAALDAAQAAVLGADAQVETARLNLDYCTIRAPIAGKAGTLMVKAGNVVKENETALVEINQIAPINAGFAVPERYLSAVRAGQAKAALTVEAAPQEHPDQAAAGKLSFIDNKVDTATGTVRLRGTFENADGRLWPGEFVSVMLTLGTRQGAVIVPARAVQESQKGTFVYVVTNGAAEERFVKVAQTEGESAVLAEGLSGGETVVTDGHLRLVPGAKVQPQKAREAAAADAGAGKAG